MLKSLAFVAVLAAAIPALAEDIPLAVGQVSVITPGPKIGTVVVGDPRIADVTVDGETTILVFGKAKGATDLVVFDQTRAIVYSGQITVAAVANEDDVVVRGPGQADVTWTCGDDMACRRGSR